MDTLDNRDLSILTQVAFKAAVETTPVGVTYDDALVVRVKDEDAFKAVFDFYGAELIKAVEAAVEANKPAAPARPSFNAVERIKDEFGATEVTNEPEAYEPEGFSLEVREQQGPIPPWLVEAAMKAGVTAVWDKRAKATGNQPLFKEVIPRGGRGHGKDGEAKPFWAPRER